MRNQVLLQSRASTYIGSAKKREKKIINFINWNHLFPVFSSETRHWFFPAIFLAARVQNLPQINISHLCLSKGEESTALVSHLPIKFSVCPIVDLKGRGCSNRIQFLPVLLPRCIVQYKWRVYPIRLLNLLLPLASRKKKTGKLRNSSG